MLSAHEKNGDNEIIASQHSIIQDPFQGILGYVSENGFLYDSNLYLVGYVTQQGAVRDSTLKIVGDVNLQEHRFPYEAGRAAFQLFIKGEGHG